MIKKMWAVFKPTGEGFTGETEKSKMIAFCNAIGISNELVKQVTVTDKDLFENLREVRKKYKCSRCHINAECSKCPEQSKKGQYFSDLEIALHKDMQNFDKEQKWKNK